MKQQLFTTVLLEHNEWLKMHICRNEGRTDHTGGYLVPTDFNDNYLKLWKRKHI